MNKLFKKLAVLLSFVLVLTAMPMSVFAEGTVVAKIGETTYTTLNAAFNAVQDGETINVVSDITIAEATLGYNDGAYRGGVRYTGDKSFTVDFGGFTVTDDGIVNDYLIYVNNKGTKANEITFQNGTIVSKNGCWATVCVNSSVATNSTELNLNNMKITNSNGTSYAGNEAVRARHMATVNVNANTVLTSNGASYAVCGSASNSVVNINNGAKCIQQNSQNPGGDNTCAAVGGKGVVNIYDGAEIVSDKSGVHTLTTGTPVINIYGGSVKADVEALKASTNDGLGQTATINVYNGTFTGPLVEYTEKGDIIIYAGTFSVDPTAYLAPGCETVKSGEVYKVGKHEENAVAEVKATCTTDGTKAHSKCDFCGVIYVDGQPTAESLVIPATGHAYGEWTETTAETCTTAAVETRVCANDATHTETRTGDAATGHTWGYNTTFDAAAHWDYCHVCGEQNTPVAHSDADGNGLCDCGWNFAVATNRSNPNTGVTAEMLK